MEGTGEGPNDAIDADGDSAGRPRPPPVATIASIFACAVIYFLVHDVDTNLDWEETKLAWFYLPAFEIWSGRYWALLTSAFTHLETWHVVFNVLWLLSLGTAIERAIGSGWTALLILVSAVLTSSYELAVSGETGIGASGTVYAFAGLAWTGKRAIPALEGAITARWYWILVWWAVGCVALDYFGVIRIANAAHFSGLLFGCSIGYAVGPPDVRRRGARVAAGVLLLGTVLGPAGCPWGVQWKYSQAAWALEEERWNDCVAIYTGLLADSPNNADALASRAYALDEKGDTAKALEDLDRAIGIQPDHVYARFLRAYVRSERSGMLEGALEDIERYVVLAPLDARGFDIRGGIHGRLGNALGELQDYERAMKLAPDDPMILNAYAWLRATSWDERVRDGDEAVDCATKAVDLSGDVPGIVDTLAAAYAEAGDFTRAVETQRRVIESGEPEFMDEYRSRLELYLKQEPYRQDEP